MRLDRDINRQVIFDSSNLDGYEHVTNNKFDSRPAKVERLSALVELPIKAGIVPRVEKSIRGLFFAHGKLNRSSIGQHCGTKSKPSQRGNGQQTVLLVAGHVKQSLRGALLLLGLVAKGEGGFCSGSALVFARLMILTRELLQSAGTAGCGFNSMQLHLLGVKFPPKSGWLSGLVGKEIDDSTWDKVVRLRGVRRKAERLKVIQNEQYIPRLF